MLSRLRGLSSDRFSGTLAGGALLFVTYRFRGGEESVWERMFAHLMTALGAAVERVDVQGEQNSPDSCMPRGGVQP